MTIRKVTQEDFEPSALSCRRLSQQMRPTPTLGTRPKRRPTKFGCSLQAKSMRKSVMAAHKTLQQ